MAPDKVVYLKQKIEDPAFTIYMLANTGIHTYCNGRLLSELQLEYLRELGQQKIRIEQVTYSDGTFELLILEDFWGARNRKVIDNVRGKLFRFEIYRLGLNGIAIISRGRRLNEKQIEGFEAPIFKKLPVRIITYDDGSEEIVILKNIWKRSWR